MTTHTIRRQRWTTVSLIAVAVALAGCLSRDVSVSESGSDDSVQGFEGTPVAMSRMVFDSPILELRAGETVTWINRDPVDHTVTPVDKVSWGDDGSGDDARDWLPAGGSWSFTFVESGTYEYYCIPHSSRSDDGWVGMTGKIIVT